jgi:hypothetical protein
MSTGLDRLDPRRFDAHAVVDRLNDYVALAADDALGDDDLGPWQYDDLDDCAHPLNDLLCETHDTTYAVRDLDGEVKLLWEELPDGGWHLGPLSAGHLRTSEGIAEVIEYEGLAIDAELAIAAIDELG